MTPKPSSVPQPEPLFSEREPLHPNPYAPNPIRSTPNPEALAGRWLATAGNLEVLAKRLVSSKFVYLSQVSAPAPGGSRFRIQASRAER
eukprot:2914474-Rhodomonas_salina.2